MSHPSKVKGSLFEREIVGWFELRGIPAKRAWGSNGQALGYGEEVDVLAGDTYRIQAKRRKKLPKIYDLVLENKVDAVVMRADWRAPVAIIRFSDLTLLLQLWKKENALHHHSVAEGGDGGD